MKRVLSAVALSGAVAFMGAAGAHATTYPAPVSDGTVAPGEAFTFSGAGFTPGETIEIVASNEGGAAGGGAGAGRAGTSVGAIILPTAVISVKVVADSSGNFSVPVTLGEEGTYTLTATGLTSGKVQSTVVTVDAPEVAANSSASVANDNLANTGADSGLLLWSAVGIGALGLGAASVIAVRRKATAETNA